MKGDKIVPHAALFNLSEEVCVSECVCEKERERGGKRNELGERDGRGCALNLA